MVRRAESSKGWKKKDRYDRSIIFTWKKENCRAYCVTIFLVNDEEKKWRRVYRKDELIDALIPVKYDLSFWSVNV